MAQKLQHIKYVILQSRYSQYHCIYPQFWSIFLQCHCFFLEYWCVLPTAVRWGLSKYPTVQDTHFSPTYPNTTKLCPAMVAYWNFNLGPKYITKQGLFYPNTRFFNPKTQYSSGLGTIKISSRSFPRAKRNYAVCWKGRFL